MSSSAALSASVSRALLDCPAAVTELLLTALSAAAAHGRLPFDKPSTLTATNQRGQQHSFLTNGNFDTGKLLTTVNAIPPLDALLQAATDYSLAATLDAIDPLILPLLDWTLHNHDVYIRQLTEEERFTAIPTDQQFAVCMPDRDVHFIRARREQAVSRGVAEEDAVTWHFHGSPSYNWHSILRLGLKNLSHTEWMGTGASHGPGIYLAPHSSTSLTYATIASWTRTSPLPRSHLVALCEVVSTPSRQAFVVIPQAERVCLRFIFALPETSSVAVTAQQLASEMPLGMKYSLQYPL